ncbi:MAG: NAD(P)/FAD-dependent oxidoreductase [Marmoricola sp.]
MIAVETIVIGAGHAGLAVSRLLTDAGHDHVVLERGRVGERWRTERWDSLHLLTPAWMTRLPGFEHAGPDADAYLSAARFVEHLEAYAASFDVPLIDDTTVVAVEAADGAEGTRYRVVTDDGTWGARNIVIATGPHGIPNVPAGLDPSVVVPARDYRSPGQLADGGVLVVGASSSGVQIADELNRAGREVTLAVGRHTRMPRRYRGLDIYWWLESTGRLARTIEEMRDPVTARREPSMQLVGRNDPEKAALDLGVLQSRGVRLAGRLAGVSGRRAEFRDDLELKIATADTVMNRFLDAVDGYVESAGLAREVWPALRPGPIDAAPAPTQLDLRAEGISTIVMATGYRPYHPWLRLPIAAHDGTLNQRRGRTEAPGVYTVGQPFQHRRDSGLIDGARHDARLVVDQLLGAAAHTAGCPTDEGSLR